jgi:hypothetical protein
MDNVVRSVQNFQPDDDVALSTDDFGVRLSPLDFGGAGCCS